MVRLIFIILISLPIHVVAQKIQVGIFYGKEINKISILSMNGNCQLHTSKGFLTELKEGSKLTLNINSSKKIHISQDGKFLGISDSLFLYQLEFLDYLSFLSPDGRFKKRKYQGDFKITQNDARFIVFKLWL